jgi:hypothetical protein
MKKHMWIPESSKVNNLVGFELQEHQIQPFLLYYNDLVWMRSVQD